MDDFFKIKNDTHLLAIITASCWMSGKTTLLIFAQLSSSSFAQQNAPSSDKVRYVDTSRHFCELYQYSITIKT